MRQIFYMMLLFMLSFDAVGDIFVQTTDEPQVQATSSVNIDSGIGVITLQFSNQIGSRGYGIFCDNGDEIHRYVRAFFLIKKTITLRNTQTSQSYEIPLNCQNCTYSNGDYILNMGPTNYYYQNQICTIGYRGTFGAISRITSTMTIPLQNYNIPNGTYKVELHGSFGEISETYADKAYNFINKIINAVLYNGGKTSNVGLNLLVDIPHYTSCYFSAKNITLDHGSLTPAQVNGNKVEQHFIVTCDGPATIKSYFDNPKPQVGDGVFSQLRLDSKNISAKYVNTGLEFIFTENNYEIPADLVISSTLESNGEINSQSLNGNAVLTLKYE